MKAVPALPLLVCVCGLGQSSAFASADALPGSLAALARPDSTLEVLQRGQDQALCRRVTRLTSADGAVGFKTNEFTVLENGLYYLQDGAWQPSEDLIESFPGGAIARRGPHKAIFSPDAASDVVFDFLASDGRRLQGGVREVRLADPASGLAYTLGTIKPSAPGEIVPPNQVVYRDALKGLAADIVYVWRHNGISQNVVLKQCPALPADLDPATTRLEVWTEFLDAPVPSVNEVCYQTAEGLDAVEHPTIGFGVLNVILGHAFALDRGDGVALGSLAASEAAVPVAKQWVAGPGGQAWLVESVAWKDLEPLLAQLPSVLRASTGSRAPGPSPENRATVSARAGGAHESLAAPMQLAGAPYRPAGLVFDYEIAPGANLTFESGKTYYNASGFYLGPATVTFQPGCVIKSANNVYLLCLGPVSFPDTLQTPVFTAVNDDSFGEDIDGTPGSVPTQCASKALWIYYVNASTEVRNARFRWAQTAVRYDQTGGVTASHTLHDSGFEHCQVGVDINLPDAWLYGWNLTKYQVTTPVQEPGYPSGRYNGLLNEALFANDRNVLALRSNTDLGSSLYPLLMEDYPACQMAAGPNHLVVLLNQVIAVFSKSTGALLEWVDLPTLFGGNADGQFDPRLLYDQNCQRWIACAVGRTSGNLHLAVSQSSDPTNIGQTWTPYLIPTAESGYGPDYPTMGVDANGLYIVVNYYTAAHN